MKKAILLKFIEKYHLSGIIGQTRLKDVNLDDKEFGVFNTTDLSKMLSALESEIKIDILEYDNMPRSMIITDKINKAEFPLADPAIIPKSATPKKMPTFNVEIDVDKVFIELYIKNKNALTESNNFAIQADTDKAKLTIGYSSIQNNTINISWNVNATVHDELLPIMFNAEYFKSILVANKDMTKGKISVSSSGLMKMQFTDGNYVSEYYMVQLQTN